MKQARAKKKIHAEQEMGEQKQREIEQLEMKIAEMKDEVTSQKATIKQLKIYQKFMDKVLEHTDEVFKLKCALRESCLLSNYAIYSLKRPVQSYPATRH